jgi:GTP diphosphokinase / guanosine-3',5'-bis(diphosphate) 3'-diphosphatase
MDNTITADAAQFFEKVNSYLPSQDRLLVQEAFALACREHSDQRRKSGELFFTHPLTVAYYLAEYHLDAPALAAALLHDIAEDTRISIAELESQFGCEVARLVDGVTKLKDVSLGIMAHGRQLSPDEIQNLSLQKLFRAMTDDVRAVIIKLFDRLHNMRTIQAMPRDKQIQKAQETLSIFAPLANRLGIWKLKSELEALALEVINEKAHHVVSQSLEQLREDQQEMFQVISGQIMDYLLEAALDVRQVRLAPENVYTVYQDLAETGAAYHEIDRTMRLVILLEDWISCYTALGYLHQLWQPVPDRFDDYISVPRDNLYRSLHTTVIHTNGQYLKLRLRTVAMDKVAEIGVLARWLYAGTPLWSRGIADRIDALFETVKGNIDAEPQNPSVGVKGVVEDIFGRQILIYTPRGDGIELPLGATPIDFAYAIHTELGDQCQAAYVNELLYPLNKRLKKGDQVRIVKGLRTEPQRAWLDEDLGYIATNYARSHARRWFRRLSRETAVRQGKALLQSELDMLGLPHYLHNTVADFFSYENVAELYYALGRAELLPTVVATRVLDEKWSEGPSRHLDNVLVAPSGEKFIVTNADGRELRLCATCEPRPRDSIVGYLRQNGVVTVHKEGCHSLRSARAAHSRMLQLGWGEATPRQARLITLQIDVYDRTGLLNDITQLMKDEQINIRYIHTPPTAEPGEMRIILSLEVVRPRQAVRILHQVQALVNVYAVKCLPTNGARRDTTFE